MLHFRDGVGRFRRSGRDGPSVRGKTQAVGAVLDQAEHFEAETLS